MHPPISAMYSSSAASEVDRRQAEAIGFIISYTKNSRISRLRFVGACHRLPGIFILDYEQFGDSEPDSSLYMFRCKDCFVAAVLPKAGTPSADLSSSDSSSSDHSSTTDEEA